MNFHESTKPFLQKHKISVLTVLTDQNEPHGAVLHYAWDKNTGNFIFFTRSSTVKYKALTSGEKKASLVIGFSDEEFCTLQMRGVARICENDSLKQAYCEKYRHIIDFLRDGDAAFIAFTPNWYRYSDMRTKPPVTYSSEA